jgi:hypothetical protein
MHMRQDSGNPSRDREKSRVSRYQPSQGRDSSGTCRETSLVHHYFGDRHALEGNTALLDTARGGFLKSAVLCCRSSTHKLVHSVHADTYNGFGNELVGTWLWDAMIGKVDGTELELQIWMLLVGARSGSHASLTLGQVQAVGSDEKTVMVATSPPHC